MNSIKKKNAACPFCGQMIIDSPVLRYYLADEKLMAYLVSNQKGWLPEKGACASCLENYKKDLESSISSISSLEYSGERTVITQAKEVMPLIEGEQPPCLLAIHGNNFGKRYDVNKPEMILGRSEKADISINEENISRQHAKVTISGRIVTIEDLQSTNGTFVNTKKITSTPLKDGDLVLVGNTILKFLSGSNVERVYHQEIYKLATMDGLTEIFNKAYIVDKLAEEFGRSRRYQRDLSLIVFDIDHFKGINDRYGHPFGDLVLKQTAALIHKNMRKEDLFGRYGGEEFVIILPETSLPTACQLGEKVRSLIERQEYIQGNIKIHITVSCGVAALNEDVTDFKNLFSRADAALYRAKNEGRNRVAAHNHATKKK